MKPWSKSPPRRGSPTRRSSPPKRSSRRSPPRGSSPPRRDGGSNSEDKKPAHNSRIVVMNGARSNGGNNPTDVNQFHTKCIEEGFKMLPVNLWKGKLTEKEWVETQNSVNEIDIVANPPDKGKGRMPPKPYFRYISVDQEGNFRTHGGGLYLYTGWSETDDAGARANPNQSLKGKVPVFMRMKNAAAAAAKQPNISIQWVKVVAIYYKPPERPDASITLKGSNGTVVKLIER